MVFPAAMYGCESWTIKKADHRRCLWTVVLEKTLESPLDCKEIQPVHPKADQSWVFIGRSDAEAETPILWPPDAKSWLIGKDPDAGKDWRQEEKGMREDEMVGWHHWLNGHELGWTLGDGDGRGGLACCSPGGTESRTWVTEQLLLRWRRTEGIWRRHDRLTVFCSRYLLCFWFFVNLFQWIFQLRYFGILKTFGCFCILIQTGAPFCVCAWGTLASKCTSSVIDLVLLKHSP